MGTSSRIVLSVVALVQLLLIGATAAVLVLRLRAAEADVERLGREESAFLRKLDLAGADLFRISILLRDSWADSRFDQTAARRELTTLLQNVSAMPFDPPQNASPTIREHMSRLESARDAYLVRVRTIASWSAQERANARVYPSQEVAPLRERFLTAAAETASVVRELRAESIQASSAAIHEIEQLTLKLLVGSAALGLAMAGAMVWKLRQYERERDRHLKKLFSVEDELRSLSQQLLEAQEEERKHLSRELHDEVGQVLTALRVQLGQIATGGANGSEQHIRQAAQLADRSLQTVRQIARGLRPAMLDDLGLGPTLKWLGRDVSNTTGLNVDVKINGELTPLEDSRRTCVYRVVQEALTNCVKHSQAQKVHVSAYESGDRLIVEIRDDGIGAAPGKRQGMGLLGMRERVEELGGELRVLTQPGTGMEIHVSLPKGQPETCAEQAQ